jgi:hypothetical protein
VETDPRSFPGNKIPAGVYVKSVCRSPAGGAAGAVQVILSFMNQDKGITDVDFVCVNHGELLDGS